MAEKTQAIAPDAGTPPDDPPRQRLRLTYEKGESIKFISHQDEFRLWERALRRAGAPLLYKQGFNPQPHMHFAAPLGVGFTGVQEYLDLVLSPPWALEDFAQRLRAKLPPGVLLHAVEEVALKAESLSHSLIGADYTIVLYATPEEARAADIEARIERFLNETEVRRERERKGQRYLYNLRPLVLELRSLGYDAAQEEQRLFLRVQQRPGATGRPDEVVAALGLDDLPRTLRRERLYFAARPDDAALFARYPVVEQQAIARTLAQGASVPAAGAAQRAAGQGGRSINERAGDEFA